MRLFQINEADLEVLERELPALMDATMPKAGESFGFQRKQWEAVRNIVSNVRWNYGPPLEIKEIPE